MVKSRRAASSARSVEKATVAWRPKVSTSRRKLVTSNGRPSLTTVTVPCSIPVGTGCRPAAAASAITASGLGVGGDVDVGDRPAEQRVADAAADEERAEARPGQRAADRLGPRRRRATRPSTRVTDPASGPPAPAGCGRSRPRCSADRRAARSSGAPGPARPGPAPGSWRGRRRRRRHLEDLGDLGGVDRRPEAGRDEADERRDREAGDGLVRVERAEHLDGAGREADLLLGLAQRRGERARVGRILLAAGKGDLARVVLQQRRAPGQDQAEAGPALDQRHQHRGGAQPRAGCRAGAGVQVEVGGPAGRRARAPRRCASC